MKVISSTATTWNLQVSGASMPFWLVLGETQNRGWEASVDGGPSLGGSTLIDGFANGWKVDPAALGAAGRSGTFDVTLDWAPQNRVWAALVISGASARHLPRSSRSLPTPEPAERMGDLAVPPELGAGWNARRQADCPYGRSVPTGATVATEPVLAEIRGPRTGARLPAELPPGAAPPVWIAALAAVGSRARRGRCSTPWSPWAGLVVGPAVGLVVLARWTRLVCHLVGGRAGGRRGALRGRSVRLTTTTRSEPRGPREFEPAAIMASLAVLLLGADAVARARPRQPRAAPMPERAPRVASSTRAPRVPLAVASQREPARRVAIAPSASSAASRRSAISSETAAAIAGGIVHEHRRSRRRSTASAWPAIRVATAGVPQAPASVTVIPHPSRSDALTSTQARL